MRTFILFLAIMFCVEVLPARNIGMPKPNKRIGLAVGSIRNRYPYPITDLCFNSMLNYRSNISVYSRLRAYGIRSFANGHDYDFISHACYEFGSDSSAVTFYAGGGMEVMLRFQGDDRSQATSGVQPMMVLGLMKGTSSGLYVNFPLWTKFYANGYSVSAVPEFGYQLSKKFDLFLRPELSYLGFYQGGAHEWRYDVLLGFNYVFH
jgi:hypothetical protein